MKYQKMLDKLDDKYWNEVGTIADKVTVEVIIPFCIKHDYSFVTGNGTWAFFRNTPYKSPRSCLVDNDTLPKKIISILTLDVGGNRSMDLGCFCFDYNPQDN